MSNERVTLAQELHDGIAQDLVVLGFSIDQLISQCDQPEIRNSLRELRFTTTALIEKVRAEMHQLRTTEPLQIGSTQTDWMHETLRVVQEILRNVQKHADASEVTIQIEDNGRGVTVKKIDSFGFLGLQERVTKLNGEIHIDSNTDGTRIGVTIPLDR
jgi:two-component system, NarL family, sensor histidine kinase LiaS